MLVNFCRFRLCCGGREDIGLSPVRDKSPYTNRKLKKQRDNTKNPPKCDNTKNPPKCSITQRLLTDLGRSVEVTTATQLAWLTGFESNLQTPHNNHVIKRIKQIVNNPYYRDRGPAHKEI